MLDFVCKMIDKVIKLFTLTKNENNIDFMCGGEALPKQLSKEEVKEHLEKLADGDMNSRRLLIEHNLRLVVFIAKRFDNTPIDIEDLISVGTVGLIKAINSYDLSKNIKLATYASRCIENEILMCLRKTNKQKGEISLDEPLNVDWEGNMLLLSDILGTEPDAIYNEVELNVEKDVLLNTFEKLTSREKLILKLRYGLFGVEERTQKEIADMMGISQSYISRLEKKVIGRLKKEMSKLI